MLVRMNKSKARQLFNDGEEIIICSNQTTPPCGKYATIRKGRYSFEKMQNRFRIENNIPAYCVAYWLEVE